MRKIENRVRVRVDGDIAKATEGLRELSKSYSKRCGFKYELEVGILTDSCVRII